MWGKMKLDVVNTSFYDIIALTNSHHASGLCLVRNNYALNSVKGHGFLFSFEILDFNHVQRII